jgi:hypothetical protein
LDPIVVLIGIGIFILAVLAAWIEVAVAGVPSAPAVPQVCPNNFAGSHGSPVWLRYCQRARVILEDGKTAPDQQHHR